MEQVTTVLELMGMLLIAAAIAAATAYSAGHFSFIVAGGVLGAEFIGISWLLTRPAKKPVKK